MGQAVALDQAGLDGTIVGRLDGELAGWPGWS
jgi:hypothetical protein